jgi:hypothetical protein
LNKGFTAPLTADMQIRRTASSVSGLFVPRR